MKKYLVLFCLFLLSFFPALAQQVRIEIGKSPVPIDEYFTISVTLQNQLLKTIGKFPEIEGFKKSSRFSSSTTNIINGQISTEQTVTQNYAALKEGEYQINPFSIEVNGKKFDFKGATIKVGPPGARQNSNTQQQPLQGLGLLDELFGKEKPQEFVDKKEDAFLALNVGKTHVYAGQGVPVDLSFYVASADQNLLDFYDFTRQIPEILKKIKPANVWEEAFEQTEIEPEAVVIGGKPYLRFKIYEAVYFPINTEPLLFPSVGLQMIKYKIAKEPGIFGENRQATYKTYYTAPKIVTVQALPPHPLRESVPVGNFKLKEALNTRKFTAGKSFNYVFEISGEGNLAVIKAPEPMPQADLEFSAPDMRQNIVRQNGRVSGQKGFRYFVTPKKPGTYDFSKIFSFIYFDPSSGKYDTLRSDLKITVMGEADNDAAIRSKDPGDFYSRIEDESNELVSLNKYKHVKLYANLVVLLLLLVSLYLFYKQRS